MLYGVEAQNTAQAVPAGPTGPYTAGAVHFAGSYQGDGTTYLDCASLTATDNGLFSFSLWQKGFMTSGNNGSTLWVVDQNTAYKPWMSNDGGSPRLSIGFGSADNLNGINSFWLGLNATVWHHYLFSIDTNHASSSRIVALYIDDVHIAPSSTTESGGSFAVSINGKEFTFGDDVNDDGPTLDVADVWIAPGVSLLTGSTIPDATRRQFTDFITGTGCVPIDPTTWPTSAIQFYGDAASFATNHGTGGAFTLTGSLTNAATHP